MGRFVVFESWKSGARFAKAELIGWRPVQKTNQAVAKEGILVRSRGSKMKSPVKSSSFGNGKSSMYEPAAESIEIDTAVGNRIDTIYDVLDRAYGFLFNAGRMNGNWNEVRSTALAGICIDRLPSDNPYWRKRVRSWLECEQLKDGSTKGSWGVEIWDTAMALLALKSLGAHTHDSPVHDGLDWIASKYSVNGRGNWHDDPWETSWALLAIISSGKVPRDIDLVAPIRWLASLQDAEGRIIAPQNTAYFVAICRDVTKVNVTLDADLKENTSRSVSFLLAALRDSHPTRLWTNEAWSNGQILWILGEQKLFPFDDLALVDKTISWFHDTQHSKQGYWDDAEDTASATLGLLALLHGLTVVVEGVRQAREVLSNELQRRIKQLPLQVDVPILERDAESGGILIRISRRKLKLVGYVISITATLAAIAGLWDFVAKHWIVWRFWIR